MVSVEAGEKILNDGDADMIGYGRSLLTDPDIALKVKKGECIRECLNCNKGCVDAIQNRQYISCVLNAENGNEATVSIKPTNNPQKVVVIGGGIAGMEASSILHRMGNNVILVERCDKLGGHLAKWDRLFPQGVKAMDVLTPLMENLSGVNYFLNTEINSINRLEKQYNVILSNGVAMLADSILFTTGFDLFKAEKKEEYGYGIYNRVITNADLENYFKTGSDKRIEPPQRIGFVHCVGERID